MLTALFDFDGCLADTKNVHIAAWERAFGEVGWEVAPEEAAETAEIDDRAFLRKFFAKRKLADAQVNFEAWLDRKKRIALQILQDSPRLQHGVVRLIQALRDSGAVRLAVVSTSHRANIETVLKAHGLLDAFELIIAKEDVVAVKPDPEGYSLAVERLSADPEQTVVIEDSPTGLAAARAAGLRVIAVGHDRPQGEWCGDAPYLPDFRDLDAALRVIGLAG